MIQRGRSSTSSAPVGASGSRRNCPVLILYITRTRRKVFWRGKTPPQKPHLPKTTRLHSGFEFPARKVFQALETGTSVFSNHWNNHLFPFPMLGKDVRNFFRIWKRRGDAAPSSGGSAVGGAFQIREPQPNLNHSGVGSPRRSAGRSRETLPAKRSGLLMAPHVERVQKYRRGIFATDHTEHTEGTFPMLRVICVIRGLSAPSVARGIRTRRAR